MKSNLIVLIVVLLAISVNCDEKDENRPWGYRNDKANKNVLPNEWHGNHPKCFGQKQSPIDVKFAETVYDSSLEEIVIKTEDDGVKEFWNIHNNGHSVKLTSNKHHSIQIGSATYKFQQMHFHWRGSEHLVNGEKFAGELHLVNQDINNTHLHTVVGFLFQLSDYDNADFEPIVRNLKEIREYGSSFASDELPLDRLIPVNLKNYYRYDGSLTTPGCDEVVLWNLMDLPVIGISEDQLLEFQSLQDKHGSPILSNSRPVQNLNGRIVRRSFYPGVKKHHRMIESASGFSSASFKSFSSMNIIFSMLISLIFF